MRIQIKEQTATHLVTIVVLTLGAISIGFLFLVEHMGGILVGATSLSAIVAGTSFGVFTLGMLIPWFNYFGAIMGAIAGALMSNTIAFGSHYVAATGQVGPHKLLVSTDKCFEDYGIHANVTIIPYPDESHIFPLFRLSNHWITPIGILTTVVVGTIASFASGKTDLKRLDSEVISPATAFQWLLPPEAQRFSGSACRRVREKEQDDDRRLMQEITVLNINLRETPESNPSPSKRRQI